MADGSLGLLPDYLIDDPFVLGFVSAMRHKSFDSNHYLFDGDPKSSYSRWRMGYLAHERQEIPEEIEQAFHDIPQMRHPSTKEAFKRKKRLPGPLRRLLNSRCARP